MDALASSQPGRAGRRYELASLLFLFCTLLLLLSLTSYLLPLFGAQSHMQEPHDNWCGVLGFYTAHYLLSFFGLTAFLPLALLVVRTIRVIRGRTCEHRLPHLLAGMSGIALASSGLFGAFPGVGAAQALRPGGYLGALIWQFCTALLGTAGTVMALILLGIVSLMAAMRLSLSALRFSRPNRRRASSGRAEQAKAEPERPTGSGRSPEPRRRPALSPEDAEMLGCRRPAPPAAAAEQQSAAEAEAGEAAPWSGIWKGTPEPAREQPQRQPEAGQPEEDEDLGDAYADEEPSAVKPKAEIRDLEAGDEEALEVVDEDGPEEGKALPGPVRRRPVVNVRPEPPQPAPVRNYDDFVLPSLELLDENPHAETGLDQEHYYRVSNILVEKLQAFGVQGEVVGISPGPVVTTYEFSPAPGVKISRVVSLADDLAMVLKVDRVRVVGSIPGKVAIGIEIPNPVRSTVYLRDILLADEYQSARSKLILALGFDVVGRPVVANLARMPHLLIAGATGAGKSVAINAFIASILFRARPDEVRLLMIDPKRIELSVYDDIPHLLHPVVVEAKMASRALLWAVREMERRYRLLEERRVKSFISYNDVADEPLPYIVIIVDELADLMMVASKDVETSIARLAQMARAAGMHIILATQRPSVDVLTGLIKANFPTRISFKVSSKVDSRTILDGSGAEHLLGMGDMLFLPPGAAKLQRIHGAFISEQETERLVDYLKSQGLAEYDESVLQDMEEEPEQAAPPVEDEAYDEKYDEAVAVVTETGVASISMVQRRLRVGYNRAARMIELMEREGIVGPADGSRPREVLVRSHCAEDVENS